MPKTLIFAKDDSHAEDIVQIVREEFGKGNDFCQKITYRTTGDKPEDLIAAFRNSYHPRIAVTVDMIATGTDIKPLEIVLFMRAVKSRTFFEQMKGRGVRVITPDDLQARDAGRQGQGPLRHRGLRSACASATRPTRGRWTRRSPCRSTSCCRPWRSATPSPTCSRRSPPASPGWRKTCPTADQARIAAGRRRRHAEGSGARHRQRAERRRLPPDSSGRLATQAAVKPLYDPKLRELILTLKAKNEQVIDTVTQDQVLEAGFSEAARERAQGLVTTFEQFIAAAQGRDHRAADPLQPPDQGAARIAHPRSCGSAARRLSYRGLQFRRLKGRS